MRGGGGATLILARPTGVGETKKRHQTVTHKRDAEDKNGQGNSFNATLQQPRKRDQTANRNRRSSPLHTSQTRYRERSDAHHRHVRAGYQLSQHERFKAIQKLCGGAINIQTTVSRARIGPGHIVEKVGTVEVQQLRAEERTNAHLVKLMEEQKGAYTIVSGNPRPKKDGSSSNRAPDG